MNSKQGFVHILPILLITILASSGVFVFYYFNRKYTVTDVIATPQPTQISKATLSPTSSSEVTASLGQTPPLYPKLGWQLFNAEREDGDLLVIEPYNYLHLNGQTWEASVDNLTLDELEDYQAWDYYFDEYKKLGWSHTGTLASYQLAGKDAVGPLGGISGLLKAEGNNVHVM